jgi:transposase-like protein
MLKYSDIPRFVARRTKRTFSADTKAELLAACLVPGASIAAIASAHGMNANVLHRWLRL